MSTDADDTASLERQLEIATAIAVRGGEVLLDYQARMSSVRTEFKGRPTELVTEADREAEKVVVSALLQNFPDHAVLAEEGVLTPQGESSQKDAPALWIVDPLDGTTNFVHGLPNYCVAISLALDGVPVLGVVHAPAFGHTYTAARGCGAGHAGR